MSNTDDKLVAKRYKIDATEEYELDEKRRAQLHEIIDREIKRTAEKIDEIDLEKRAQDAQKKSDSLLDRTKKRFKLMVKRVSLFGSMLRDTARGQFGIPLYTTAALAFGLLYFTTPVDLILDALPGIGFLDDAFVLSVIGGLVRRDLERYVDLNNLNPADYFPDATPVVDAT